MTKGSPTREDKRDWHYRPKEQSRQRKEPLRLLYKLVETNVHKQGKRQEDCEMQWILKAALRFWFTAKVNTLHQGSPTPSRGPVLVLGLLGTLLQAKCPPTISPPTLSSTNDSLVPKSWGPDHCSMESENFTCPYPFWQVPNIYYRKVI